MCILTRGLLTNLRVSALKCKKNIKWFSEIGYHQLKYADTNTFNECLFRYQTEAFYSLKITR